MLRRYSSSPLCKSVHRALCWQTSKQLHLHKFGTNMALRYTISNNSLQLLRDFLGLTPHLSISDELRDVIFVAIDFENLGNIKQDYHVELQ
jgi:hypothetical protein